MFYVSDLEKQSQFIKLFKEYDLEAVIANTPIDNNFISFFEYKDNSVKFTRIDSDLSDVLKDKEETEENKETKDKLSEIFKEVLGDKMKEYTVQSLKKEETPAMVLISEHSRRMAEMQAQFGAAGIPGMNFPDEKTLVINDKNPIIKKIIELQQDQNNKAKVEMICNQVADLALIGNQELKADGLEAFIKRTNDIMMLVLN